MRDALLTVGRRVSQRAAADRSMACSSGSSEPLRRSTVSACAARRRLRSRRRSTCGANLRRRPCRTGERPRVASICASTSRTSPPGREWIPMPVTVQSGQGAMRVWFDFADGRCTRRRRRPRARRRPHAACARSAGAGTGASRGTRDVASGWRAAFAVHARRSRSPSAAVSRSSRRAWTFATRSEAMGAIASGRIASSRIDLRPLSQLASQLPLPADLRVQLARHAPQGTLSDVDYAWQGTFAGPSSFRAQGAFAGLGTKAVDAWAGFSGVSGRFDATQAAGTIHVASRNAVLTMPKVFAEPIALDSASGRVRWERPAGEISVRFDEVQFANAHTAGTAQGTWKSSRKGSGRRSTSRRGCRGPTSSRCTAIFRWSWVWRHARGCAIHCVAGAVDDARLTLKGDLSRFPFPDGKSGTFLADDQHARRDARLRHRLAAVGRTGCADPARRADARRDGIARTRARRHARSHDGEDRRPVAVVSGAGRRRRGERSDQRIPAVHHVEPGRGLDRSRYRPGDRCRQRQAGTADSKASSGRRTVRRKCRAPTTSPTTSCAFPARPR